MKLFLAISALALFLPASADAFAGRSLTLYLDGALVEQRETARKGYLEISVPPAAIKDSLKIAPAKGVEILRVEKVPRKPVLNVAKELSLLDEREERLNDRLKALSVREEIFKSAAKSQSGKAPRRTKTNPEPLSSIKQGTDYAIAQLEAVYHSKRKAEKELAQIAERRASLARNEFSGGTVARVWLTPANGRVVASWSQPDRRWLPSYQARVDDYGNLLLSLTAAGVTLAKGETAVLALGPLLPPGDPPKFRYENEKAVLKKETFIVTNLQESNSAPFSVIFSNSSPLNLPGGEISCFRSGVYMGKGSFQGAAAGNEAEIVCGD